MKKLMRKLVLSSFALGLAVITLSTTTFAWYTSNVKVDANGINHTTASSGDPLLMIADSSVFTGATTTPWGASVTDVTEQKTAELVPLQRVGAEFHDLAGEKQGSGWLQFTLYFKNASTKTVELYIQTLEIINNNKDNLPAKDVLAAGKKDGMADTSKTTYKIDVLRTLLIETTTTVYSLQDVDANPATPDEIASSATTKLWNPETLWNPSTQFNDDYASTWNAIEYYNGVMNKSLTASQEPHTPTDLKATGTKLSLATVPAAGTADTTEQYVEVVFCVFINGWDLACFDACQGQSISINLSFTTVSDNATICA